jgi:hypothetical protein
VLNKRAGLIGKGVNQTHVWVVWSPSDPYGRSVIQVTVRIGKHRSEEEHLALQNLLAAVMRLKEAVRWDSTT